MKPVKKRIFIVDDHPMIREGTAAVINQETDLVLCGAASTVAEALTAIPKAKPDVVVVDLSLEGRNGLELIKCLRSHYLKLPVVVYTMHEEALYGARAMADGACGYVTKRQPSAKLLKALRQAAHATRRGPLSPSAGNASQSGGGAVLPLGHLSDRELEVFELRGQGLTGDHIAARLHLSRKTVDTHLEHIKHKLRLANSGELLRCAVRWMHTRQTT